MPRLRKDGQPDRRAETAPEAPCKTLSDPEQAFKAGVLAEAGNGRRIIEGGTTLTEHQSAQLARLVGMPPEVFREQVAARLQAILDRLSARLFEEVDKLKPESLAINFGILSDKYLMLRGLSSPTTINQTNIQINGVDRSQAMAQLGNTRSQPKEQPQQALSAPRHTEAWDVQPLPVKAKEMALADGPGEQPAVFDSWNGVGNSDVGCWNGSSPSLISEQQAVQIATSSPPTDPAAIPQVVGNEHIGHDAQ